MGFLRKLFGLATATIPRRHDVAMTPLDNEDILSGYQYCATLQLRTPLFVLQNHQRREPISPDGPPEISTEMWHGIWVPELREEFGFLNEGATTSSEIGYVPADGGDYLPFLKAVRVITEQPDSSLKEKEASLRALVKESGPGGSPYSTFISGSALVDRAMPRAVELLPVSSPVRNALISAGYDTLGKIEAADDKTLLTLKGVGPKSLAAIRDYLSRSDFDRNNKRFLREEFKAPCGARTMTDAVKGWRNELRSDRC